MNQLVLFDSLHLTLRHPNERIALMLHDSDRLCFDVLSQPLWKTEENVLLYVRRILLKHLSRCFSISSDAMNLEQRGQWKPEGDHTKTRA